MNNAKSPPYVPVPLEDIGGLYTEATPESLPLGASPLVINCDFIIGSGFQRPGKQNVYAFGDFFVEKVDGFASSIAGASAPNEVPWTTPSNATLNTPGVYAVAALNTQPGLVNGTLAFDKATTGSGIASTTITTPSLTPTNAPSWGLFFVSRTAGGVLTPDATWANYAVVAHPEAFSQLSLGGAAVAGLATYSGPTNWVSTLLLFGLVGAGVPTKLQENTFVSGAWSVARTGSFSSPITAGSTLVIYVDSQVVNNATGMTLTDTAGNVYVKVAEVFGTNCQQTVWVCNSALAGSPTLNLGAPANIIAGADWRGLEISKGVLGPPSNPVSHILHTLNYPFSIPSTIIPLGFQVEVSGKQTAVTAGTILTVALANPAADSPTFTTQLGTSDGTVAVGTALENWGLTLTPNLFNNPNFAINVFASALDGTIVTFDISAVKIKVYVTPDPPPSFNYIKTFSETGGEVLTLALGSDGVFYQEDVLNDEGVLFGVYTAIQPNSFAQSATIDDREFIAISNLQNGTDIPYTYTPPNFDRLSQVGPGAPPTASSTSSASSIVSITQLPPVVPPHENGSPGFRAVLWSVGPTNTLSGNTITVFYQTQPGFPAGGPQDPNIVIGQGININGVPLMSGKSPNGNYVVTSIGSGVPPNGNFHNPSWYFTVTVPTSNSSFYFTPNSGIPGTSYQVTIATMTTSAQVPNLEVGNQFQLSGTGGSPPAGYDGTWIVIGTPNASQMQITSTVLTSNVATYGFNLITGTAPVVGQLVTVVQTLNGNGVFNISNGVITSTSPGIFSVALIHANVSSSAESGSGIIFGTIFTFDPLQPVGTRNAGSIITTGIIAAGVRKVCYSYLTRNGFMTQPSPILTFDVPTGGANIIIGALLPGPSDVIARVIHLTAANGGNFYNIPVPVTVNDNGTDVISTSTWINDNVTTQVVLSFSDGVLLTATQIDIQGNNLFECIELGSCVALVPYAQRLFAVGEQNKVMNFLNYSFDGGIAGGTGSNYPAGWVLDPTNGSGGDVASSPIFGFAYKITNSTGITQATYGMITQPAFQDEFQVPIINPSTTYSVRVTFSVPTGTSGGNLVVDLFSASFNKSLGTFTQVLSAGATTMRIFTGTLLTTTLAPVPSDLVLRLYATSLPAGVQVLVDRVEVFPTEAPNLNGQVIGSYKENFESFDRLTGVVLATQQNQQPVVTAFTLFGTLYLQKTGSIVAVNDNNTTEPAEWTEPRVISNSVGSTGPYAVTTGIDDANSGEEWSLIGGRAGLFLFNGSQPVKLSEEIQQLWNLVNWKYGHTVWAQNDITNRRILIGVPMKTFTTDSKGTQVQNQWLPAGIITDNGNPTTPNIVLELNYKQLSTAGDLVNSVQVHRSGQGLGASDMVRKWSVWTIKAPCASFIKRSDNTAPLFLGNSDANGKIFDLIENLFEDDGAAIDQRYFTAGFVTSETGQGSQMGVTRFNYDYATMVLTGKGDVRITVYPNSLDTPYAHALLPDLTLPASTNGDVEIPVNEVGSRLFVAFTSNAVGAGFNLSRMIMVMHQDPWSPVRGVNK